jgi:hypothetical protein
MATASHVRNTIGECIQATASMDQAASLGDFTDEPLVVLTAAAERHLVSGAERNGQFAAGVVRVTVFLNFALSGRSR